ncbi:MAG TPA: type IX secretion system membrane protein PorP/SprF [Bacteroidales bacterium]|nr:type IX secretion system membrane protein PorP/SprF [Bacteroidales bacterium]
MKRILIYILFLVLSFTAWSQQTPMYTLYTFNDFLINPAIAGTKNYYEAKVNNRYQFAGIENAPVTATLSLHGRYGDLPMGIGGIVYNDSQGAFSKFGVYGAYSYILPIDNRTDFSLGLNVGLVEYKIDISRITFIEPEYGIDESLYKYLRPDATFGAYVVSRDYYAGLSVDQLFNNKIEVINDTLAVDNSTINRITSHATLIGGMKMKLSYGFVFEPSVVVRKTAKTPLQVELTGCVTYEKSVWAGVSVRSGDAVAVLLGYNYRRLLTFGYAYDITYSSLCKASNGSHEVMLGVKFNER